MVDLRVRCPEKLPMEELNQSELLEAALVEMIPAANINPVTDPEGPWEKAFGVEEVESNEECNALLSINRYTKIDVDLKCLKEVITTDKADMLKDALDEYFEKNVVPEIVDAVEEKTPESAVYSVKSPYDQDGDTVFCYYDSYYNDGTLVDQFEAGDGNTVTKFKCGFDIVWFKDKGFSDSLLPDLVETVQNFFIADDPSFLTFLQAKYNETTWVQTTQECGVVDPNILDPATPNPTTPNPTTASPTAEPTENPTKAPTASPTQKPTAAVCHSFHLHFCLAILLFHLTTYYASLLYYSPLEAHPLALQNLPRVSLQLLLVLRLQLIHPRPLKAQLLLLQLIRQLILRQAVRHLLPLALPLPFRQATPLPLQRVTPQTFRRSLLSALLSLQILPSMNASLARMSQKKNLLT